MVFLDYYNRLTLLYPLCVTGQVQTRRLESKVVATTSETAIATIAVLFPFVGNVQFEYSVSALTDGVSNCFWCDEARACAENIQIAISGEGCQSFWIGKEPPQVRRRDIGDHRVDGWRLIARQ